MPAELKILNRNSMKKLLLFTFICSLIWAGCKEHDNGIDTVKTVSDTSYIVTPIPTASQHQVLVEEFTGQTCPNCPGGKTLLDGLATANPGRINIVSMYTVGSPDSRPPTGAIYDFRDSIALNILNGVFGNIPGLPSAGIDRVPGNGLAQLGAASWTTPINAQLQVTDSVNLVVTSSYDSVKKIATITAGITYTRLVSTPQNLSMVIVEDSISDLQTMSSGSIQTYLFLDVFCGMVTSAPWGDPLQVTTANNAKEAGRFFQKTYTYSLPVKSPAIVPAHCRVIAFVNNTNGTDVHVMQSAQCKFAP